MSYPIEVRNVSKRYIDYKYEPEGFNRVKNFFFPKKKLVLDKVSFKVEKGEIFGLLGPNGAGKTTLIKIMTGLMAPDSGEAWTLGHKMPEDQKKIAHRINAVFARSGIYWHLTGRDNLMFYAKAYRIKNPKEKVNELLKLFEMDDKAHRYMDTYSTGEMMRISLAKGLINDPELLLVDEPTIGLDPSIALKVRDFLQKLNKEVGVTILLTTHYMEEADRLCHRLAFIEKGKILRIDTPKNLKKELAKEKIIELEIPKLSKEIVDYIKKLKFIDDVMVLPEEEKLRITFKKFDLDKLTTELKKLGVEITSVNTDRPNLEDVFLHITGRRLRY
jgi:ABC-2 type transport system ATP-binding protein